jgi:5'-deoxynucleotidase YfbR-like HD superfamily hydrolase
MKKIDDYPINCIRTNTGSFINVFETSPDMIHIEDIAHALSRLPRFGGHLNRHYSVAQHCVMAVKRVKGLENKKAVLLHDASEAYLLDMPSPIKAKMKEYKRHEDKLMAAIFKKFNLEFPLNPVVKKVDREMLDLEWENLVLDDNPKFKCWSANKAKREFLKMYNKLFLKNG